MQPLGSCRDMLEKWDYKSLQFVLLTFVPRKHVTSSQTQLVRGPLRHRPSWSQAQLVTGPLRHGPSWSQAQVVHTHTHTHTHTHKLMHRCSAAILACDEVDLWRSVGLWRSGPVTNWACDQLGRAHTHTHTHTHAQVLCCYLGLWRSGPVTKWACDQLGSPLVPNPSLLLW